MITPIGRLAKSPLIAGSFIAAQALAADGGNLDHRPNALPDRPSARLAFRP